MLINRNEEMNGIEIQFNGIPSEETRNALKEKSYCEEYDDEENTQEYLKGLELVAIED